jgi:hypothetical protein
MNLPRFYVSPNISPRGIVKLKTIEADYKKIQQVFGKPSKSESAGDNFDGFETVSWTIKFENGLIAEITDSNAFGNKESYTTCKRWNIYGHYDEVAEYVSFYLK